jgi:uncharacterized protein (TIGR00369 family)
MPAETLPTPEYGVVPLSSAIATSGLAFLRGMLERVHPSPPFAETTDIRLVEVEPGRVSFEAAPSRRFYNPLGTVHGGWLSTLLDSAMGCAVHSRLNAGEGFTTVDMTVSFVRAVTEDTGTLRCEGKLIHLGGRIATAEGRIVDPSGALVAHGTETCMILRPRDGGR